MAEYTEDEFGQFSETETFDLCYRTAEIVQAFYLSGNTSKSVYDLSLYDLVDKIMKGEDIG
jgi:hypothetical protein